MHISHDHYQMGPSQISGTGILWLSKQIMLFHSDICLVATSSNTSDVLRGTFTARTRKCMDEPRTYLSGIHSCTFEVHSLHVQENAWMSLGLTSQTYIPVLSDTLLRDSLTPFVE